MSKTTTERKLTRYRVRRWTALSWDNPREGENFAELQRDRAGNLDRAARLLYQKLLGLYPDSECSVVVTGRDHSPQLMFTMMVDAEDSDDACAKAKYRIGRTLAVKVPAGGGGARQARLMPPWGQFNAEVVDA